MYEYPYVRNLGGFFCSLHKTVGFICSKQLMVQYATFYFLSSNIISIHVKCANYDSPREFPLNKQNTGVVCGLAGFEAGEGRKRTGPQVRPRHHRHGTHGSHFADAELPRVPRRLLREAHPDKVKYTLQAVISCRARPGEFDSAEQPLSAWPINSARLLQQSSRRGGPWLNVFHSISMDPVVRRFGKTRGQFIRNSIAPSTTPPLCPRCRATLRRNKLKGATAMLSMFSGGGGGGTSAEEEKEFEEDRDRLRDFQFKMMELQVWFGGGGGED